jgi:hypothetical protein
MTWAFVVAGDENRSRTGQWEEGRRPGPNRGAANFCDSSLRSWTRAHFEMYREAVDQVTRDDIAAAAAAHEELGRDYDSAIAESLVDRIGAEIDKRIDNRLDAHSSGSHSPAEFWQWSRNQALWTGLAIGAGITGLLAMIKNQDREPGLNKLIIVIWVILAVACVSAALGRRSRSRQPRA